ncbi:endoglucanase 2-like isoform X2 [Punica granatum]|uniref:Endoglucanase n=1 Tax=Punica granatum TaxID=22663 RepID=A0A6P8DRK7_PUNGR|nr:endoglucanase 2-like isoform X2 [Punica granatum]
METKIEPSGGKEDRRSRCKGWWWWWFFVFVFGVLVVALAVVTILRHYFHSRPSSGVPSHPGDVAEEYVNALGIAMQFFDVQKCMAGKLVNNRIAWRGDSGLEDGRQAGVDLSKGMYDAGDLMKFGFPMAFTATVLSWAILEYGDQMDAVRQLDHAHDSLKWITDYLINAHVSQNVLYIQVGDPKIDHDCWERPETTTEKRPLTQVNVSFPGTEVAAETAAAMASASMVFRKLNSTYSGLLLNHAQQLFAFADTYRGSYSISIPQLQQFYNSSGYGDELLWAASWLYLATEDRSYLRYVTVGNGRIFANWGTPSWFSWDDKYPGVQVLLSRINFFGAKETSVSENVGLQKYRETAEMMICRLLPDSATATSSRTESGLIWVTEWNSLLHPVASAFLTVLYSDYMLTSRTPVLYCSGKSYKPADLREFAISQVDYVLGKNPVKLSYLVGYGIRYPQYVHHRGSSIPINATTGCQDGFKWLHSPDPNPNVAAGAVVGGPFLNETYIDSRKSSTHAEPSTYNSALLVGLLSGLVSRSSVPKSFV